MKKHTKLTIPLLAVGLAALILISVLWGRYPFSLTETGGILLNSLGVKIRPFWNPTQEALLLNHRLPRVLMACLVGCALSSAGASYQGVFQNPMAAPDLLGASSGAAFGACLALLFDLGPVMVVLFAFLGGLITVGLVVFIGGRVRGQRAIGLILAGIMVSSLMSSGTSFIKLVADPADQLPAITYWLMGSLNGTQPKDLLYAFIPVAIGCIPLFFLRWRINILTLGDDEAQTIGVNTRALRLIVILCATVITAASVAVSGMIGWVGLVIPHLTRKLVGNNYRRLMPASMLAGAFFLLLVDDLSRNLLATEIPIGILTSVIGAPFFIYLIVRDSKK